MDLSLIAETLVRKKMRDAWHSAATPMARTEVGYERGPSAAAIARKSTTHFTASLLTGFQICPLVESSFLRMLRAVRFVRRFRDPAFHFCISLQGIASFSSVSLPSDDGSGAQAIGQPERRGAHGHDAGHGPVLLGLPGLLLRLHVETQVPSRRADLRAETLENAASPCHHVQISP